jgi:hypothetical protein
MPSVLPRHNHKPKTSTYHTACWMYSLHVCTKKSMHMCCSIICMYAHGIFILYSLYACTRGLTHRRYKGPPNLPSPYLPPPSTSTDRKWCTLFPLYVCTRDLHPPQAMVKPLHLSTHRRCFCLCRSYTGQWETHCGNKTATAGTNGQHAQQQA